MAKSTRKKTPPAAPSAGKARTTARDRLDVAKPFDWRARADRIDIAIVLGVALALRLLFYFLNRKLNPTFSFPVMDSLYHHEWALDLVAGGTSGTDAFFRGPLYPYFLSLLYRMSDSSIAFAVLVQHLIGALTAGLIYLTARELFSRSVSLVAGLTTALYWVLVYMEGDLLLETTFIFLNTLAMFLLLQGVRRHSLARLAAGGFALGLATITRPSIMVFFPAVPIAIYLAGRARPAAARGWIVQTFVVAAACALPILPVMVRNYTVAKAIVPVGASGGVNFYIGNNPASDGSTAIVPGTRADWWGGYNDAIALAERARGRKLTLSEVSDYYFERGFEYLRTQPGEAWRHMGRKFMMFWGAGERANDKYIYFFWHLAGMKHVPLPGFWLVAPLAILGGVLLWRRRNELAMFYLFVIVYSLGVVAFFVNARFRLPIVPVLTLFSAYACVHLVRGFRERRFGVLRAVVVLAAAAIFVNSDYAYQRQMRSYAEAFSNYTLGNAYLKMGLEGTALDHFSRAAEIDRAYPTPAYRAIQREVDYNLGVLLWKSGLCSRSIEVLERVGGSDELAAHALDCLGDCYLKRRDLANATRVYERMLQLAPSDQRAITGLARCAAMSGDLAKAESMLAQIVDPTRAVYAPSYVALAEIQRAAGKIDAAIRSYTHIAQLTGYERQGLIALAELHGQKGDIKSALAAIEKARMFSPPNDPTLETLSASLRSGR
ncbi:MAG TPA: glycosyltransferase family 39 protein [Candidatus Krumholzibacteria bacterium]|nr:glycosyltransferase family 39 protein [Candidatus Krumholzibacteria bacterium]